MMQPGELVRVHWWAVPVVVAFKQTGTSVCPGMANCPCRQPLLVRGGPFYRFGGGAFGGGGGGGALTLFLFGSRLITTTSGLAV